MGHGESCDDMWQIAVVVYFPVFLFMHLNWFYIFMIGQMWNI